MPIPQIPIYLDVAAGAVVAIGGYTLQEWFVMRRRVRSGGPVERVERRRGERATETAGVSLEQQAEDLAAAIDVMVAFVDGPPRLTRARSCASQVGALVPPERRGPLTRTFVEMIEAGARPAEAQEFAESVCVQMAVELRAILARASRQPGGHQEQSEHAEAAIAEAELMHTRPSLVADVATATSGAWGAVAEDGPRDGAVGLGVAGGELRDGAEGAVASPEPAAGRDSGGEPPSADAGGAYAQAAANAGSAEEPGSAGEAPAPEALAEPPPTPRRARKATPKATTKAGAKPAAKRVAKNAVSKPATPRRTARKVAAATDDAAAARPTRARAKPAAKRGGPGALDPQAELALDTPDIPGNYEDYT